MFTADVIASDKVALIISNRTYMPYMTNLITPHCDAETLADSLQQLKFKTVTLGDLRINEMKYIIQEYRKLLGDGVYGLFLININCLMNKFYSSRLLFCWSWF